MRKEEPLNDFLTEILSQPQTLLDTFNYIRENQVLFQSLKNSIKKRRISKIIFTGMGSSFFSSYVPYYILNESGIHAEMRESGEFLFYSFPKIEDDYFEEIAVVLISQSGESGEVIKLLRNLNRLHKPPLVIGITNAPKSILAMETDLTFFIKAGDEKSVTSKSYTCTLLLLYVLARCIVEEVSTILSNKDILLEIESLIEEVNKFLEDDEKFNIFYDNLLSFYGKDGDFIEILTRGPSLATAYQAALNFKEIVKSYSEASPCSTFNHGGIECLNKDSKVIIISSEENNFKLNVNLIKNILNKWECKKILHITNFSFDSTDNELHTTSKIISFKHNISNPFLSPIFEIIILQLFFYKMAEKRGLIPGKFKFTQKITRDL